MPKFHSFLLAAMLAATAGAAVANEAPTQKAFPSAEQLKPMSVQHWNVIADDLVGQLSGSLDEAARVGVHFQVSENASPFSQQLVKFMAEAALKRGLTVYSKPRASALTVNVSSDTVSHRSAADSMPSGCFTALSAGVLVRREIALQSASAGFIAGGVAKDIGRAMGKPAPRNELVVSFSVEHDDQYLARSTNVYYVEGADLPLFTGSTARTLKVEGSK